MKSVSIVILGVNFLLLLFLSPLVAQSDTCSNPFYYNGDGCIQDNNETLNNEEQVNLLINYFVDSCFMSEVNTDQKLAVIPFHDGFANLDPSLIFQGWKLEAKDPEGLKYLAMMGAFFPYNNTVPVQAGTTKFYHGYEIGFSTFYKLNETHLEVSTGGIYDVSSLLKQGYYFVAGQGMSGFFPKDTKGEFIFKKLNSKEGDIKVFGSLPNDVIDFIYLENNSDYEKNIFFILHGKQVWSGKLGVEKSQGNYEIRNLIKEDDFINYLRNSETLYFKSYGIKLSCITKGCKQTNIAYQDNVSYEYVFDRANKTVDGNIYFEDRQIRGLPNENIIDMQYSESVLVLLYSDKIILVHELVRHYKLNNFYDGMVQISLDAQEFNKYDTLRLGANRIVSEEKTGLYENHALQILLYGPNNSFTSILVGTSASRCSTRFILDIQKLQKDKPLQAYFEYQLTPILLNQAKPISFRLNSFWQSNQGGGNQGGGSQGKPEDDDNTGNSKSYESKLTYNSRMVIAAVLVFILLINV